jgi:hypothetical protein
MSTRATYATKLDDNECLGEALKELPGTTDVQVRENGTISARVHGRAVSFRKADNGMYEVVMVGEAAGALSGIVLPETDDAGRTTYKLGQLYGKAKVLKAMRALKGTVVKDEVDEAGTVQIRIRTISFE